MEDNTKNDLPTAAGSSSAVEPKFSRFMNLPLEVRQKIYASASEREYECRYVLKAWLDKIGGYLNHDDDEAGHDTGAGEWGDGSEHESDDDEDEDENEGEEVGYHEEEEDEQDDVEEDEEDEAEDADQAAVDSAGWQAWGGGDGQSGNVSGQGGEEEQIEDAADQEEEDEDEDGVSQQGDQGVHGDGSEDEEDQDAPFATAAPVATFTTSVTTATDPTITANATATTDPATTTNAAATIDSTTTTNPGSNTDPASTTNPANTTNPAPQPVPKVVRRRTPYRHTVGMFGLSASPPPTELLQAIKGEVKEGYYGTAFFYINVTKGVRHITFFEETINKFCEAAYSPLEQMRKMEINVHWSSQWLKDHESSTDDQGAEVPSLNLEICEFMFMRRVELAANLIAMTMPEITHLKVRNSSYEPANRHADFG